jgi:hypothetical protein
MMFERCGLFRITEILVSFRCINVLVQYGYVLCIVRGADNHLLTCQMRVNSGLASKNTNPLTSLASVFSPLTDNFHILGQLFSDLASVLENLSTPLV